MRTRHVGWILTTMAVACLLLITGSAYADKYKDESGHGKGRYAKRYDGDYDRHYDRGDDFRGYLYYDSASRAWSGHVSWWGKIGGVGVRVDGSRGYYPAAGYPAPAYPPVRYYEPRHRHPWPWRIPAGHLPPPGACRVWYSDRPAGHQPPPTSCHRAEQQAHRYGGIVIYGGPRH